MSDLQVGDVLQSSVLLQISGSKNTEMDNYNTKLRQNMDILVQAAVGRFNLKYLGYAFLSL